MDQPIDFNQEIGSKLFAMRDNDSQSHFSSIHHIKGVINDQSQFLIIEGYKDATKILLDHLLNNASKSNLQSDSLIFPVLFIFRHYIEIALKDTLRCYKILHDQIEVDEIGFKKGHSLLDIWSELKPFLKENYLYYSEDLKAKCNDFDDAIEEVFQQLDGVDKDSFGFRYAFKGERDETNKIRYALPKMKVDLERLKVVIGLVIQYVENISWQVKAALDEK